MGRRRRQDEEPVNHERWLVSYADFITLLFAFFVVMYAVSSVNEGKYRVLSESLSTVFTVPALSEDPIQIGELPRDVLAVDKNPAATGQSDVDTANRAQAQAAAEVGPERPAGTEAGGPIQKDGIAQQIMDDLKISLQGHLEQDLVRITKVGDRVEIEMKERMLFGSGGARLSGGALGALGELAKTFRRIPTHLQVEGHTDNVPISTAAFPSNWELSAARAASVVNFFARSGVEPWRMSAVGLAEHRPVAENADARGRAANRRVTIVVLTSQRASTPVVDHEVPWAEGPGVEVR